jgi:glutathione peroxidase
MKNIYSFTVNDIRDRPVSLNTFNGKFLLIVNTASECGFTPQYKGLEKIYRSHKKLGLEILAFPCNQFGNQEPGTNEDILNFCTKKYSVTFPIFAKIEVKGKNIHPLFEYLCDELPGILNTKTIKWNFTKFFIDKEGKPIKRFSSKDPPEKIIKVIDALLS